MIERYRYDAYGAATVLDADHSADSDNLSDVSNPYLFTGRRLDPESTLMQYRRRYYDATSGRFVGRDPIKRHNLYPYAAGTPTVRVDPLGLLPTPWDILAAIATCTLQFGIDAFFREVSVIHGQICTVMTKECRSQIPPTPFPWTWAAPEIDWADFADFVACVTNDIIGIPIFDDSSNVTWHRNVWVTWHCGKGCGRQTVYVHPRAKLTVTVQGQQVVFWQSLGRDTCGKTTYKRCCK